MNKGKALVPILYIIFLMVPIYWLVNMSFKTNTEINLEVKIETDKSPCLTDRIEIFEYYLRRFHVEDKIDVMARELAELSSGFHGGDIEAVCRDGAMTALRNSRGVRGSDLKELIKRRVGSDDLFLK